MTVAQDVGHANHGRNVGSMATAASSTVTSTRNPTSTAKPNPQNSATTNHTGDGTATTSSTGGTANPKKASAASRSYKARGRVDNRPETLDDLVNEHAGRFSAMDTRDLEAQLRMERDRAAACSHIRQRGQLRMCQKRIRQLERRIADIRAGVPLRKFNREVARTRKRLTMIQRMQQLMTGSSGKVSRLRCDSMTQVLQSSAPFLKPGPPSKSTLVRAAPENVQDMCRLVLDEFEHKVAGKPLPMYMNPLDICDECNVVMHVDPAENVLVCPTPGCRVKRVADASHSAVLQHVPVADSMDYSSRKGTQDVESRLEDWMQKAQALESGSQSAEAVHALCMTIYNNGGIGIEKYMDVLEAEVATRGDFTSIDDMLARLPPAIGREIYDTLLRVNATYVGKYFKKAFKEHPHVHILRPAKDNHAAKTAMQITGFRPRRFLPFQVQRIRQLMRTSKYLYTNKKPVESSSYPGRHIPYIHALCVLHGWDEFLEDYPLPSMASLLVQEPLRKTMWEALGWQYIPLYERPPPLLMVTPVLEGDEAAATAQPSDAAKTRHTNVTADAADPVELSDQEDFSDGGVSHKSRHRADIALSLDVGGAGSACSFGSTMSTSSTYSLQPMPKRRRPLTPPATTKAEEHQLAMAKRRAQKKRTPRTRKSTTTRTTKTTKTTSRKQQQRPKTPPLQSQQQQQQRVPQRRIKRRVSRNAKADPTKRQRVEMKDSMKSQD